ncbi:hypothetical protein LIA77_01935 [Sarocladium implicatum]|nr:hypothetical protein LIA77_01935 [Sarocladium implicatum]
MLTSSHEQTQLPRPQVLVWHGACSRDPFFCISSSPSLHLTREVVLILQQMPTSLRLQLRRLGCRSSRLIRYAVTNTEYHILTVGFELAVASAPDFSVLQDSNERK